MTTPTEHAKRNRKRILGGLGAAVAVGLVIFTMSRAPEEKPEAEAQAAPAAEVRASAVQIHGTNWATTEPIAPAPDTVETTLDAFAKPEDSAPAEPTPEQRKAWQKMSERWKGLDIIPARPPIGN